MKTSKNLYISQAYQIIILLALGIHIIFTFIFVTLSMKGMAYYNAFVAILYCLFFYFIHKKYYKTTVTLVHLEVCCFITVSTLVLGWDFGFPFYLIALASLTYFNPYSHKKIIYIFPFLELLLFFTLRTVTLTVPFHTGESYGWLSQLFYYTNFIGCFTIIFVVSLVSKAALNTTENERDRIAYDKLTGVFCKEHLIYKMEKTLKKNTEKKYYLIVTNILGFKYYNEIFGTKKGDEVLLLQADYLKKHTDYLTWYGRISGDEFAALIERKVFHDELLEQLLQSLQTQFTSTLYRMHIHAGIYPIEDQTEPVISMLDKAEMAISSIKEEYTACFAYYNEGMLQASLEENKILGEFEHALEDEQFCFFLQPQVTADGTCFGAEALVRWLHPERGLIAPGNFIPILERTGLICRLDLFIWEEVAKKLAYWNSLGKKDRYISVNISARDFYSINLYEVLTSLIEKYQLSPKQLKLEITETALMMDIENQIPLLKQLQQYGFEIEIDDFGSGYSSLNTLKDILADVLKIDMVFLQKTEHSDRSWSILSSIMELASSIGMSTITEGVETQEQMENLTDIGCSMFQGYYFSRPIPVADFEKAYL